jgi:hypothetical protein
VVILNKNIGSTRALVTELMETRPNIRLLEYPYGCAAIGLGYIERVREYPACSLAKYYSALTELVTAMSVNGTEI